MIDRATTSRILEAANIVDVVSEFVSLRKAGANYKGLCPFHDDRTPSFSVSPARNYAHCFSCGKGGSPVSFIMEHEQMTYPEALRWLARKYNIEVKEKEMTDEERKQESERESMFIINEYVADYYHNTLKNSPDGIAIGMQYFRSRGFRDDIIEKFRLGFALDDRRAMPDEAVKKGYKGHLLLKTGLCYENDRKQLIDRFAGRAIFPWISMSGKVVAFGGRKLDKATKGVAQKYVNSPDSDIYHKDHELYGIYQAKRMIAKENLVYMVEGYTDVISMHQCGIENVVANSGTALSTHQVHMLHRLTNNIVLLYDGDEAGIHAALRGTDMLLSEGMNVKVLLLPDGDDPDSFSKKHTAEEFVKYVEDHQTDFIQFKTDVLLNGVSDPIKRSEAISSIVKSISVIPDTIVRATYIQDCSMRLRMREQTLIDQMNRYIRSGRDQEAKQAANQSAVSQQDPGLEAASAETQHKRVEVLGAKSDRNDDIKRLLIQSVVRYGEDILYKDVETDDGQIVSITVAQYIDMQMSADDLTLDNPIFDRILSEAVMKSQTPDFHAAPYFSMHPDLEISRVASTMLIDKYTLSKGLVKEESPEVRQQSQQQYINHLLFEFRKNYLEARMKELLQEIAASKDNAEHTATLMMEYQHIQKLRGIIARKLGRSM